jgi:general secretion pathway protein J
MAAAARQAVHPRGFTLIEVMVALLVMSVIAMMGWRGIDSMARTRELAQASAEKTLRLSAIVAQFEADLMALQDSATVPGLAFDGASLRMVRRAEGGLQVVVWALRAGRWQRWAGAPTSRVHALQESWIASQQLQGQEPAQMNLLQDVAGWQVYFYRGGWSNAQSTGDIAALAQPPIDGAAPPPRRQLLPAGVRVVLELPEGRLTRDVALGPQLP